MNAEMLASRSNMIQCTGLVIAICPCIHLFTCADNVVDMLTLTEAVGMVCFKTMVYHMRPGAAGPGAAGGTGSSGARRRFRLF